MAALRLEGRSASPGLALGPLARIDAAIVQRVATGDPMQEAAALRAALAAAATDLETLVATVDDEAADIIAFQIAMIGDEALSEGAFDAIAAGIDADHAWQTAMDNEIAGYEAAEDDYFRARAADLADIRERVARHLAGNGETAAVPAGAIIVGEDLTPSRFLSIDWRQGGAIALSAGSSSSHVAMLARARGVPMLVGLGAVPQADLVLVDASAGEAFFDPDAETRRAFEVRMAEDARRKAADETFRLQPGRLANGEMVRVLINVAEPDELDALDPAICDGVGLTRTEFLFHATTGLPDEDTQAAVYGRIAEWAAGRPVTIRTLDAGGDKPIAGLTIAEANPFLGLRGIRLSLARPEIFRVQLRALARAAVAGNIRIMLPMVSVPDEVAQAAAMLDEEVAALRAAGINCARPPLGIMVEVPAAALNAESFPVDFYSVGSNDLTQYTMAASRDSAEVSALNDAGNPAVIELIRLTVAAARRRGVDVSLCGDAGADPGVLPKLIDAGLRSVSVAPVAVGRVKAVLSTLKGGG